MAAIAVIGCGVQGSAVVQRLRGAGYDVLVHDAHREKAGALAASGAHPADTASAAIARADYVLTVVTAGPAVKQVLLDPANLTALGPGKLVVQMGTQSPGDARECQRAVESTGAEFVTDVIHGPRDAILAGQVLLLFGGSPDQHRRVVTLLSSIGQSVPVGNAEQAAVFNAAGLCVLYALLHSFAIGSAMIERAGIPLDAWFAHVKGSAVLMDFMAGFIGPAHFSTRNYGLFGPCQFSNDGAVHETAIISDLVQALALDRKLAESFAAAHRKAYDASARADFTSVYDVLAPSRT